MTRSIPCLALTLALAAAAQADVVKTRDGRRLEGSISRDGDVLVVRQRFGEARVPAKEVLEIVDTPDAWDELERLRRELSRGTAEERYRFAVFCRDHGFEDEARRAFLSVLRVDLDHPGARAALGYVQHEGRWITQADLNRLNGLVEHEGEWVTPEEKAEREEAAREAKRARREAAEAEREAARAEREAEREAAREARRARREAYEAEVARARAAAQVEAELARNRRGDRGPDDDDALLWSGRERRSVLGSLYGPYYYGVYGRTPLWGCGGARRRVIYGRSSRVRVGGSLGGGSWQLRWQFGY